MFFASKTMKTMLREIQVLSTYSSSKIVMLNFQILIYALSKAGHFHFALTALKKALKKELTILFKINKLISSSISLRTKSGDKTIGSISRHIDLSRNPIRVCLDHRLGRIFP
jgi:hypothetical protein